MKQNEIPILAQMDCLFLDGTDAMLKQAAVCAKDGKKVMVATYQTFLPTDIVMKYQQDPSIAPVIRKREAEAFCDENGIQILYGVTEIESCRMGSENLVLFATKGGLYGVVCKNVFRKKKVGSHFSGVFVEREEKREVIGVSFTGEAGKSLAEALYQAREQVIESALKCAHIGHTAIPLAKIELVQSHPNLKLGRFFESFAHNYDTKEGQQLYRLPEDIRFDNEWSERLKAHTVNFSVPVKVKQESCDVLVVGGGTAGVMAAIHAARRGAKTTLLEWQFDLGGTSTIGGVNAYWFGNRFRPVMEVDEETYALYQKIGLKYRNHQAGFWSKYDEFHSGLRSHALFKLCFEAGVNIVLGQQVYGVVSGTNHIREVISAGIEGNMVHGAKIIIDATGDGDIAIWSGADSVYGSAQDMITYWASLGQFVDINNYQNNFSSMMYVGDPVDITRFIRLSRQRGNELFDHSSYVSMRESRHIVGLAQVDLRDACLFKQYEDALYTCYSNHDPKGKLDADMIYGGWLPPQGRIQIPLSALIPVNGEGKKIEGLYVAGKAISATHNVFAALRMQPDLMQQGAVLGLLAAKAIEQSCFIEDFPKDKMREWIITETGDDLTLPDCLKEDMGFYVNLITEKTLTHWVGVGMTYEEKEINPYLAILAATPEAVLPQIKERLKSKPNPIVAYQLKRLALWHGCDDYTCDIISFIKEQLQSGKLPKRKESTLHTTLLPDHGVMTELTYDMNLLAWSKKSSLEIFELVANLLAQDKRDYHDKEHGIYHYIESFAYVAERTGNKDFLPLLKLLQSFPEFEKVFLKENQADLMTERLQILILRLGGARARLGDREGYICLIQLLAVDSISISLSSAMLLKELLHVTPINSKDQAAWHNIIDQKEKLPMKIITEKYW